MTIQRLLFDDGSWAKIQNDWKRQCDEINEDFSSNYTNLLDAFEELAKNPSESEWAMAVTLDGRFTAAFILILANQKGYDAPVLRVRNIVVCPLLDDGILSVQTYGETLVDLLYETINVSETLLVAKYIKMHVRSPADLTFFATLRVSLDRQGKFESTDLKGAWLTLAKK